MSSLSVGPVRGPGVDSIDQSVWRDVFALTIPTCFQRALFDNDAVGRFELPEDAGQLPGLKVQGHLIAGKSNP